MKLKNTIIAIILGALTGTAASTVHAAKAETFPLFAPSELVIATGKFTCDSVRLKNNKVLKNRYTREEAEAVFQPYDEGKPKVTQFGVDINSFRAIMTSKESGRRATLIIKDPMGKRGIFESGSRSLYSMRVDKGEFIFYYHNAASGEFRMMLNCVAEDDF